MKTPGMNESCSICKHPFADHYTSYSGKKSGCAWIYEDQRDGITTCPTCPGYAIIYRYHPSTTDGSAEAYTQK
jgi:hypothetical protein